MSRRHALFLLIVVALCWGLNWPVGKLLLEDIPPIWVVCLRSAVGTLALLILCLARGRLVVPKREDLPVIGSVGLLHMTLFSVLVSVGLQFVDAGRSVVLAYTTPIWVLPGAYLLLGEKPGKLAALGALVGLCGLMLLFMPGATWHDSRALHGNLLVLVAAGSWALSILYVRAHKWHTPPFELTFWQALLATLVLVPIAYAIEGPPTFAIPGRVILLLAYGGVFGIAIAYWAITTVNKALPSSTTAIGLLMVPIFGILCSWLVLDEQPGLSLLASAALILAGVLLGTLGGKPAATMSATPTARHR